MIKHMLILKSSYILTITCGTHLLYNLTWRWCD